MELAKRQTMLKRKLSFAKKRLQSNLDKKNKAQAELDDFEKMVSLKVAGGSTKAFKPVKVDMAKLYSENCHRFTTNAYPDWLARMMADGSFQPNRKGIYSVVDARNLVENYLGQDVNYMTIWMAMRRITKVYGLAWPVHAAGMKAS